MRALVQRVTSAGVEVSGEILGRIGRGLLVYVGVAPDDTTDYAHRLAEKVAGLRIFEDEAGKMNLSVQDVGGDVLAVPNFTLMADARRGRRPSFATSAAGPVAQPLYEEFVVALVSLGCRAARGSFGAHMHVTSVADGPVNLVVDFPPAADLP